MADSYQESITAFTGLPVPAYFSEYGCNTVTPRTWTEVVGLFGAEMSAVYSGGIAYSYFPTNDPKSFGMVTVDGNTVTTSTDFTNLGSQYSAVTFLTTPAQSAATANTPPLPSCPGSSVEWLGSTTVSQMNFQIEALIVYIL